LPISEKYHNYAKEVFLKLQEKDIRGFMDERDEKIGRKIRDTEVRKVPYMLIVGEKEVENQEVSIRKHGEGDKGSMSLSSFEEMFQQEVKALLAE